jgi:5-oxoprolinase (ATP-hydrolysing) subunit A
MTATKIDINVDIAEGFPFDDQLLTFATSANVCCGSHAGTESLTRDTVRRCQDLGVRVGAHPGYPDPASMGRAPMTVERQREWLKSVTDQVSWFCHAFGADYLKPHGAFYNETAILLPGDWETRYRKTPDISRYDSGGIYLAQTPGIQLLAMLLRVHKLPLMGLSGTAHAVIAKRAEQRFMREGFADRRYMPDGTLMPRSMKNSTLTDLNVIREQVMWLAPKVDSICLHGDGPGCVEIARLVRKTLEDAGYVVSA